MTTFREKSTGYCSQCHDNDAWLVGTNSGGAYCDKCEEVIVTDEDLVFEPTVRHKIVNAAKGAVIASFLVGFFLATVLFENQEISEFVRRFV